MKKIKSIRNWYDEHEGLILCTGSFLIVIAAVASTFISFPVPYEGFDFNLASGFYSEDIAVEIETKGSSLAENPTIKYNMDGDSMEESSTDYNGPIALTVPETGYKLYTITAEACSSEGKCFEPKVATYILGKDLSSDVTLDVISLNSPKKGLYDYEIGILVPGIMYDQNKNSGAAYIEGNYNQRGKKWERDAHLTMLSKNGDVLINQPVLIETSGGTSSAYEIKSLKISRYSDGLKFPIKYNEEESTELDSFRIRAGGQDQYTGNVRSSVVSRLAEESGFDGYSKTKRAVVFLNGEYYGLFDIQQNFSDLYLATKYGLPNEKNVKKAKGAEASVLKNLGCTITSELVRNREELEKQIDIDNYLTYYALEILWNNTDWPMNSFEGWKYAGIMDENKYTDGRIRFLVYDTDLVYYIKGNAEYFYGATGDNFAAIMEDYGRGDNNAFRIIMKSDYYRNKFLGILKNLMSTSFETNNVLRIIDEEANKIEHQVKVFSSDKEYQEWKNWIALMKKAASERNAVVRADVRKYFGVDL